MFDESQLKTILLLHEKSFALLRWTKGALLQRTLSFNVVHEATDSAAAAEEWIRRHWANIPTGARPLAEEVSTFARLFVSFLSTSFRLKPNAVRLVSDGGCGCLCCSFLEAGPNLILRTPSKKDFRTAESLKRIYLERLASELGVSRVSEGIERLLAIPALAEAISMATWSAELMRRSEFASQGDAVLALWRGFVPKESSAKRDFRLTVSMVMDAERKIIAELRSEGQ